MCPRCMDTLNEAAADQQFKKKARCYLIHFSLIMNTSFPSTLVKLTLTRTNTGYWIICYMYLDFFECFVLLKRGDDDKIHILKLLIT